MGLTDFIVKRHICYYHYNNFNHFGVGAFILRCNFIMNCRFSIVGVLKQQSSILNSPKRGGLSLILHI